MCVYIFIVMGNSQDLPPKGEENLGPNRNTPEISQTRKSLISGVTVEGLQQGVEYSDREGVLVRRRLTNPEAEIVKRKTVVQSIISRYFIFLLVLGLDIIPT
jgi:hypothetical protein